MGRSGIIGLAIAGALAAASVADATPISGTMYYTTFVGGVDVHKVDYSYNGTNTFTLSNNVGVASTPGADGIVFTSDGFLAVGGQGNAVYRVNPTTGAFTSQNAAGTSAFHMMVGPDGTIYSSGIPGQPARYNSTLTNNGTALTVSGSVGVLDTLTWDNTGQAFYTESSPSGFGSFGTATVTSSSVTTSEIYPNLAAAHGMTFDPFTNTLILFGNSHITQIDPVTHAILGDLVLAGDYDQGSVDGLGHIFAANNDGDLTFLDISTTHNISAAGTFISTQFLADSLDDVAPLSGPGSGPSAVPEPASLVLLGTGLLGVRRWRKRRNAA
jgi:hypothetical protein